MKSCNHLYSLASHRKDYDSDYPAFARETLGTNSVSYAITMKTHPAERFGIRDENLARFRKYYSRDPVERGDMRIVCRAAIEYREGSCKSVAYFSGELAQSRLG